MKYQILCGDVTEMLAKLPDECVHCVITSPPYWGLRDYGVPGQIGLEATPEEYVARMVEVFREVNRVLRRDGVCFVNMGDAYQDKQLVGMPWRLAFALQADGWYLRQDIIWAKPNPMPESVTDRCTKAHEYVFLLSRSPRYYYDAEAVKEDAALNYEPAIEREDSGKFGDRMRGERYAPGKQTGRYVTPDMKRNRRSVWTVASEPFSGAHFATFPTDLIRPMILAATSAHGVCPKCGKGWERDVRRELVATRGKVGDRSRDALDVTRTDAGSQWGHSGGVYGRYETETTGWHPACDCVNMDSLQAWDVPEAVAQHDDPYPPVPATVLDPFGGSGTTAVVALQTGRNAILIELNPAYAQMAQRRIETEVGLLLIEKTDFTR